MNKKKSLALLLESGDAFAQAVPDEMSDVHVGNEITSFVEFNWVHLMGGLSLWPGWLYRVELKEFSLKDT